ncbi:MAG: LysR family transcriptional regulator [Mycobacterium sp.]
MRSGRRGWGAPPAERLHVAQPWVSAQLRPLEKTVHPARFVRDGGRLVFTVAGARFYVVRMESSGRQR